MHFHYVVILLVHICTVCNVLKKLNFGMSIQNFIHCVLELPANDDIARHICNITADYCKALGVFSNDNKIVLLEVGPIGVIGAIANCAPCVK